MSFLRSRTGAAVLVGCLFVFGAVVFFGRSQPRSSIDSSVAAKLGSVEEIIGKADHRLPQTLDFVSLREGAVVVNGEMIVAHEATQVVLKFDGGASVRLQPGARLVAEKDPSFQNAVMATLLEGDADILTYGSAHSFRLFKNGRDLTLSGSSGTVTPALISSGSARTFTKDSKGDSVVVTASTPAETPTPPPVAHVSDEVGGNVSADSLSNEEIRKTLRSAGGYFQRCYLTFLNRVKTPPNGANTVTVGFVISNSGKVRDAKIVRTDFNDAVLNNCILETVERAPFRAFKASDIPVLEFPIELR